MGILVTHPLDTLRVHIQTNPQHLSVRELAKKIYRQKGYKGFFSGVVPPVVLRGIPFAVNREVYARMRKRRFHSSLAGGIAGCIMSAFESPVHLVKTRSQLSKTRMKESLPAYFRMMHSIARREGFMGLYSGLGLLCALNSCSYACFYAMYDTLRQRDVNPFISGMASVVICWVPFYPLDILRTQKMAVKKETRFSRKYFTDRHFIRQYLAQPKQQMYQGLGTTLVRAVPRYGITMATCEALNKRLCF